MDAVLKLAGTCVAELGKYVTATHAKYAIWAVMGAGSIPKLLGGGPMKKQFPKLPDWFYLPAGLWARDQGRRAASLPCSLGLDGLYRLPARVGEAAQDVLLHLLHRSDRSRSRERELERGGEERKIRPVLL